MTTRRGTEAVVEMKYFAQALRDASRHKTVLAAAIACSLAVAVLWSLNIAALFPIIQTTLNGESLQSWNQERIDRAETDLATHEADLADIEKQLLAANPGQRQTLEIERSKTNALITRDRLTAEWAGRIQPIFERWMPSTPFATVVLVVCVIVAATAVKQLLAVMNQMLVAYVSQSIARDVRSRVFNKALALDRPQFNKQGVSGFTAHITHTTDMLAQGITAFYGGAVTEPLRIITCLILAAFISWRLTLASLIFAPLAAFLMLHLNRRIRSLSYRVLDRSLGFHHIMIEVFNALNTVQAYSMEDFERKRFREATGAIKRTALMATFYNTLSSPITELLGIGMLCTGLCVSSYLVIFRATSIFGIPMTDTPFEPAIITVFFGALIAAADPLRKLSGVITGLNTGMAAANLLYPMLEMDSGLKEPSAPKLLPATHKQVEFRNISFSYDGLQQVLDDVSLTVRRGEHLAIVGPNGGGKSTLISLLCRFYDPVEGEVLIDGVSLRDLPLSEVRRKIALVTQQTELFNETILHNIRYGRWDATEAEVIAAAELARAHEFISGFTDGYQTVVGANGQRLSGGQRQRISLARAFLKNADILILDEATSQIDVDSERLIHDALDDYGREKTMIMITHRESTLSLADKVVRVEYGKIEQVKHESRAA
ncbi:ABC transporter ATP-binding protein [Lacipirellula sp.]|uniref:ABC transporter ATP-binding protein n=1 Tax=Lacipirellula sp. TaxID=2691419 RepID=UPI003D0BC870